jgi:hypothetical protein
VDECRPLGLGETISSAATDAATTISSTATDAATAVKDKVRGRHT